MDQGGGKKLLFIRIAPFFEERHPHPRECQIPYAAAYLASLAARHGWSSSFIDTWPQRWTSETIVQEARIRKPDLIVVDCDPCGAELAWRIGEELVETVPAPVVFVGAGWDVLHQRLEAGRSGIHAIHGDPEMPFQKFLCTGDPAILAGGDGPHITRDLDDLPFIDLTPFPPDQYVILSTIPRLFRSLRWGFILSSRGCPFSCQYCSPVHRKSYGREFRSMSPGRIVDELLHQARNFGRNIFFFADDIFNADRTRLLGFCEEMRRRKIEFPWSAQCRPDLFDRETIQAMKAAGCFGMTLGIESGSQAVLDSLGRGMQVDAMKQGIALMKDAALSLSAYIMIGNPGETMDDIRETENLIRFMKPISLQINYLTNYPGSRLSMEMRASWSSRDHYHFQSDHRSSLQNADLKELSRKIYRRYIFSSSYLWKFARNRLPYALSNLSREARLAIGALAYLASR